MNQTCTHMYEPYAAMALVWKLFQTEHAELVVTAKKRQKKKKKNKIWIDGKRNADLTSAQQYQLSIPRLSPSHVYPHAQSHRQKRHWLNERVFVYLFVCRFWYGMLWGGEPRFRLFKSSYVCLAYLFVDINAFGFRIECHTFCVSYLWINKQTTACFAHINPCLPCRRYFWARVANLPYLLPACHHFSVKVYWHSQSLHFTGWCRCRYRHPHEIEWINGQMQDVMHECVAQSECLRGNITLHCIAYYLINREKNE